MQEKSALIARLRTAEQERSTAQSTLHNERQHFMEAMQNMENELIHLQPLYQAVTMPGAIGPGPVPPGMVRSMSQPRPPSMPSMPSLSQPRSPNSMTFDRVDSNGDGVIDRQEFDTFVKNTQ